MTELKYTRLIAAAGALSMMSGVAMAQTFTTDVIIQGSLCVGVDCSTGESFGFDTIRLKENNLRIKFQDTSTSASFPSNDWTITANDSSNGGNNYLRFDDVTNNRVPFTVEAGAQTNTLYVEGDGDVGIKTNNPAVDIHIVEGNTPTVRLEQDGSDGFTSQIYDIASNETNFFFRDVTNGSRLFFRAEPSAPENSIYIDSTGYVGMNRANPTAPLHIVRDVPNDVPHIRVVATRTTPDVGEAEIWLEDGNTASDNDALRLQLAEDSFNISFDNTGGPELRIRKAGDVEVLNGDFEVRNGNNIVVVGGGSISVNGSTLTVPDYVFAPDYELMPLDEVSAFIAENSHLPHIPSAAEVNGGNLDLVAMQLAMLKTVEELTLYTLDQHQTIAAQAELIETLEERLSTLEQQ